MIDCVQIFVGTINLRISLVSDFPPIIWADFLSVASTKKGLYSSAKKCRN